ncbi:MAG: tetratricopeptide repeat protein [Cyanobacteriota bacterium]
MKNKIVFTFLLMSLICCNLNCNNSAIAQNKDTYSVTIKQNVSISGAEKLLKDGNIDGALEVYKSILDSDPGSLPARIGIASVYSQLFKIKAAQREFLNVIREDPNNSQAHNGMGMTYYRMTTSSNMDIREKIGSLYRRAADEFEKAIACDPTNDEAIANLGMIYQHQGRFQDAESHYRKALELNPLNPNANYRLGTILYENGDVDSAISYYQEALKVDSKNSSAHFHLGEALIAKGRYSEAIESLQTSLYLNPNSAPVQEKLGEAYKHQGNETAAIEAFKKSIAIKPEDTLPYLLLSSVYEDRGDDELAIAELKSALKNNPDFSEAKLKIADMSLKLNKVDQSVEFYKKTLIDDPGNPNAEKGLSKAYFRKVQSDVASGIIASPSRLLEAEKYVDKAISNNPEDLELYYAKFKLEKMSNKPEPTQEELQQMSQMMPTNIPEALNKSYALFKLKEFQQADQNFRGVLNQVTDLKDKLMIAETLIEYNNYNVAEEIFNSVLAEDHKNVQAQRGLENISKKREDAVESYRLGWDLYNKGQRNSALDQFRKAKAIDPTYEKSYYWAAETLKKDDKFAMAYDNYRIFLILTENINLENADKDMIKRRKHAVKMLQKLEGKQDKE